MITIRQFRVNILIALGIFMLSLTVLLPLTVAPRIAVLPANPNTTQVLKGTGFTVFFPQTIKSYRNRSVTITAHIDADPQRRATDDTVFWRAATRVWVDGLGLERASVERMAIDKRTSLPSDCCPGYLVTEQDDQVGTPLRHSGYLFTFPFSTKKRDYPVWDVDVRRAVPARYTDEAKINGLKVYHFVQTVPDSAIGSQVLPGESIGFPDLRSVDAQMRAQTTREMWVEPTSGVPLMYTQHLNQRLVYRGNVLPVFRGTISTGPTPRDSINYEQALLASRALPWLEGRLSLILGPLGALALLAGIALHRRGPRESRRAPERSIPVAAPSPAAAPWDRSERGAERGPHDEEQRPADPAPRVHAAHAPD